MVDTAGTLIEAIKALRDQGANKIYSMATHGVLSGPALERIDKCEELESIIITDTIEHKNLPDKVIVLSVADILSKAIHRTFNHDSVSSLFV